MQLIGGIKLQGKPFYLMLRDNKRDQTWYLIDRYHKDDRLKILVGEKPTHPVLGVMNELNKLKLSLDSYLLEAIHVSKINSKLKSTGNTPNLIRFLETLTSVNSYSFNVNSVILDNVNTEDGVYTEEFRANDGNVFLHRLQKNRLYHTLDFKTAGTECVLRSYTKINPKLDVELKDVESVESKKKVGAFTVSTMTMNLIENLFDISWYKNVKTGEYYKDYKAIKSIPDFERMFMKGFIERIRYCLENNIEIKLCIDSETTGLTIADLSSDNPDKDHIVALPISFKPNTAFVIFNDMEYFDNVPKEYMFSRLKSIVEDNEKVTIEYRVFKDDVSIYSTEELLSNYEIADSITIDRKQINLLGHNVLFDGKVLYDDGLEPEWNNDTLQMAFNLNPKVSKAKIEVLRDEVIETEYGSYTEKVLTEVVGGVGLKNLTRRLFGHETLELSDVLGKGNEGNYRLIADEEVALIYGGADVDYPQTIHDKLKEFMGTKMYAQYQKQDMPMINILYKAEYHGLPMNAHKVLKLAEDAEIKLNIIKNFLYNYVGMEIDYRSKLTQIETKYSVLQPMNIFSKAKMNDSEVEELKKKKSEEIKNIKKDPNAIYEFDMKGKQIRTVLYDILKYPILGYTKGDKPLPSTDKYVLKKLMGYKENHNTLKADIKLPNGEVIISADKFNSFKYPVAYVLRTYLDIDKDYTSYFKPIKETNLEGRLFKSFSLSRIETRRIMNPAQTMKSSLKALTIPYNDDYYLVDFDMAQVEYRIMASLAHLTYMVERLKDPEKDFHTESAASLSGIAAHKIEKSFRKMMKSVHFGIPYGLGVRSLCDKMFGKVNDETLAKTVQLLHEFKTKNYLIIDMLEHVRDKSFEPLDLSDDFKRFAGFVNYEFNPETNEYTEHFHKVGKVENLLGFYRLFDLEDLDERKIASIRRMAGNYPIQAFAAELFRIILIRFYNRCKKEGIADKIKWHLLIHDELLFSAHKSLNPFFLYKLILEECMVSIKNHTKYFVGINIGDSWKECKDDLSEAPVLFVQRMVKRWEAGEFKNDTWIDNAKEYVNKYKDVYIKERIHEVLQTIQPNMDNEPIYIEFIQDKFANYTVRAYLGDFFIPPVYKNSKGKPVDEWYELSEEDKFSLTLEYWSSLWYGVGKEMLSIQGKVFKSRLLDENFDRDLLGINYKEDEEEELFIDLNDSEEEDDDDIRTYGYDLNNWSFDEDGSSDFSECMYLDEFDYSTLDDKFSFDFSKYDSAKNVAYLLEEDNEVEHLYARKRGESIVITIPSLALYDKILKYLEPYKRRFGLRVIINCNGRSERALVVMSTLDIDKLNVFINEEVKTYEKLQRVSNNVYNNLKIRNNDTIMIQTNDKDKIIKLAKYLKPKKAESGYTVKVLTSSAVQKFQYLSYDCDLKELDDLLGQGKSLSIKPKENFNYVYARSTYIIIDVKDNKTKDLVKKYLTPYIKPVGTLIRFKVNGAMESWLKVSRDIDLTALENYISGVSDK